jgi:hypothetical protein
MLQQRVVYFARCDFLAAAVDHLVDTAKKPEKSIRVPCSMIAGAEPAVDEQLLVDAWIMLVAAKYGGAAHEHFACLSRGSERPVVTQDCDVVVDWNAHRPGLRWSRGAVGGDDPRFCGSVALQQRNAKQAFGADPYISGQWS